MNKVPFVCAIALFLLVFVCWNLPSPVGPEGWMPWDGPGWSFVYLRYLIHDTWWGTVVNLAAVVGLLVTAWWGWLRDE